NPFIPASVDIKGVRGMHDLYVIARLKDGVDRAQAQAEMEALAARQETQYPESNGNTGAEVIPLHESILGDVRPALLVILGAVGLALALQASSTDPQYTLREGGRSSSAGPRIRLLRNDLDVCEMAVALVLLAGAGLVVESFIKLERVDPGLSVDGALTLKLWIPDARYA